jgi:hypothetical protein
MVVMITSTGVYLIVAVVLLVIVGGGVAVGYRKYSRQGRLQDQQRATGGAEPPPT